MSGEVEVQALFEDEEECVRAIEEARAAGLTVRVFAPVPSEKILAALGHPRSPVRLWVLIGGISGAISGFALTIGLSMKWPHFVGGKPIVSIPPFVIIAFELMILLGGISGVLGFLIHGRFPQLEPAPGYSPRFSEDRFGVIIRCDPDARPRAEEVMRRAGAHEVKSEIL